MNIKGVVVFVVERRLLYEVEMVRGYGAFKCEAHLFEIPLTVYAQALPRVLLESSFSSGNWRDPCVAGSFQEIHQHLFVIASQTDDCLRIIATERQDIFNTPRCVCSTV